MCCPFKDGFVLEAWEETRLKDCWSSKQYWCIAKASIHPRSIFIGNFCHNNSDKRKLEQKCKCWQLTFIYWNQSYLLFENQIHGVSVSLFYNAKICGSHCCSSWTQWQAQPGLLQSLWLMPLFWLQPLRVNQNHFDENIRLYLLQIESVL